MTIKTLIKTLASIRDGLQRRHIGRGHPYTARIRARATGRLRGASAALIGSGALLIALGVGLRDLRRRIEHTPSLADQIIWQARLLLNHRMLQHCSERAVIE